MKAYKVPSPINSISLCATCGPTKSPPISNTEFMVSISHSLSGANL